MYKYWKKKFRIYYVPAMTTLITVTLPRLNLNLNKLKLIMKTIEELSKTNALNSRQMLTLIIKIYT